LSNDDSDPISQAFKSATKILEHKKSWQKFRYQCEPWHELLPLTHSNAFYGENSQIIDLIAKIIEFIQEPNSQDFLFLKGPTGSGKTIFAHIFEQYSQQLSLSISYQDASKPKQVDPLITQADSEDVIFLDNAFHSRNSLTSTLNSASSSNSPKIIALMKSSEFEIYRRQCIQTGDKNYKNFYSMPHYSTLDIIDLLNKRLIICFGEDRIPPPLEGVTDEIAELAFGNVGFAIDILKQILLDSRSLVKIRLSYGINFQALEDFSPSKSQILREILIRETENESLPPDDQKYIIHKVLTNLLHKTKSTISHHLSDLLSSNLIYEQSTTRDRREKAYRPHKGIFGILEYLAFESSAEDAHIILDGTYYET